MKSFFVSIIILMMYSHVLGQLNCETKKQNNDSTITTCYHKNGKASTIEKWDKEHRWGSIKAFDASGKEILYYQLRNIAGHASVYVSYYSNGQISKAEYSSMPDGGIQWYRYYHEFNELGAQTSYIDLSMPDGYPVIHTTNLYDTNTNKPTVKVKEKETDIVKCSTPQTTGFKIVNETNKKVKIYLKALSGLYINKTDKTIELNPKQSIMTDSVTIGNKFLDKNEFYEPEVIVKKGKKNLFKLIEAQPETGLQRKIYTWYVLSK